MNKYDELLLKFVATEDMVEPDLTVPSLRGDKVFASNGHIAIMIPRGLCEGQYEVKQYPNFEKVLFAFDELPDSFVEKIQCPIILNMPFTAKFKTIECEACEGWGYDDDIENEADCPKCKGTGEIITDEFLGNVPDGNYLIKFHDVYFNSEYFWKVLNCFEGEIKFTSKGTTKAAIIEQDNIKCWIMPVDFDRSEVNKQVYEFK